jgi:CRISPR-associated protein Csx17
MNTHHLTGCAPAPLASYLKALGVLRLVSEQADPSARGFWQNESFSLQTALTADELAEFFLAKYAPTPLVDPWNRGSGFLSSNDKAATNLAVFENSTAPRFAPFRAGIRQTREIPLLAEMQKFADTKKEFEKTKPHFIKQCRLRWRGSLLEWLDAAIIIGTAGTDLSLAWPSLLGTGGNDGRLDFTDNFRQRFLDLFDIAKPDAPPNSETAALLQHALFGSAATGSGDYAIGQYAPGNAGGANSSNGLTGKANVNPWDFVLFMEGAVLFAAAASRRLGAAGVSGASAPFALRADAVGHASVSAKEKSARGEQWFPLWERPASLREIRALLAEGRAQLGRATAREPVDMARAIARLGVARGITAFTRYGYIERNGQANFAVPLGRWRVAAQPRQNLLADLDAFLRRLSREAAGERATARLATVARNLNDAVLAVAADGSQPANWQTVLAALADADALAAALPPDKNKVGILPSGKLRPEWLDAADDGTAEFRLAAAFASQPNVRRHFLPLNKFGNALDPQATAGVVCNGRDFTADALALLDRLLVESAGAPTRAHPQIAVQFAVAGDIAAIHDGSLDPAKILTLARTLMALDWRTLAEQRKLPLAPAPAPLAPPAPPQVLCSPFTAKKPPSPPLDDAFALFRFCLAPSHWRTGIPVRPDIFRRLAAGDLAAASRQAAAHLRAHGLVPPINLAAGDARRLAAALAFPLSTRTRDTLARAFISTSTQNQ